ncbi:MAG: nitrate reductase [Myxococcales bacterium FL481]|nr:MAG: nitrate reductase [Myxococcales bacterium FL481]
MSVDRRTFLQATALATATAAVAKSSSARAADPDDPRARMPDVKWDKAPCRFCGTGCHVQVGVKAGRVVAVTGDRKADVNRGLLCMKGYHVGLALYGEDRLTTPLLKQGDRHVPISWERAIEIICERVEKGPKGFAFYGSGQWTIPEGYAAQKFMKGGLRSNHIDPNARLCMASAVTGFIATYGVDEPAGCYDDLDAADVVILWGNNPAEMHPVLFSRIVDRRSRGEKVTIIDIGTRRTRSTAFADHFLQMKPHGDLAIASGVMQMLLARDQYNKDFVAKNCAFRADSDPPGLKGKAITFDEYRELMKVHTAEACAEQSGLSVAELELLCGLFADPKLKITSLWCMGMNQHTQGTAVNTLVHGLHLLSGHFGRPGDAPTSLTGQPSACGTAREVGTLAHALPGGRLVAKEKHREQVEAAWNVPKGRIDPKPGFHTVKMWRSFSSPTKEERDVHTIWVQVTNPAQSLPNRGLLVDPSRKLADKFLIVSDVYPTETTKIADLILPSSMWVEKNGIFGNSERRTQQWFKMVEPPKGARDDCWQVIAVARKLYERGFAGMRDKDGEFLFDIKDAQGQRFPAWQWDRYYDLNVDKALYEEYRQLTFLKHKHVAPYDELVKSRGLRWPVVEQSDGSFRETRFRFSGFDDPFVEKGREIQFYHSTSGDDRAQIWFRPYVKPPEVPDAEYPLWLCTGRVIEHWHTGSMTMRIPQLQRSMPHAYVELNPKDAAAAGIQNGQRVVVETRRGQLELPAWIDGRGSPPAGTVFIPFFDERLVANILTLDAHCRFSKEPDYKKCAARVRVA